MTGFSFWQSRLFGRAGVLTLALLGLSAYGCMLNCRDVPDPLDDMLLACGYRDEGDVTKCAANLPLAPERRPGAGQLSEATRTPEGDFEGLFFDRDNYARCGDIFDRKFLDDIADIAPMPELAIRERWHYEGATDPIQQRMATVFSAISTWTYCHRVYAVSQGRVQGEYQPTYKSITLYATSCEAEKIYNNDLRAYNATYRYYLVAAHELGHAIDDATGRLRTRSGEDAERIATLYGSSISQCAGRQYQAIVRANEDYPEMPRSEAIRIKKCTLKMWEKLDHAFGQLRQELRGTNERVKTPLANVMRCITPNRRKQ